MTSTGSVRVTGGVRLKSTGYHLRGVELRVSGAGTVPVVVRGPAGDVLARREVDLSREETGTLEW